jgi:hypothetical protein
MTARRRHGRLFAGADGFVAKDDFVVELPPLLESLFPVRRELKLPKAH